MGFKAQVNVNGLSGELYFTVITSTDNKFSKETTLLLRGFESRERMVEAIAENNWDIQGTSSSDLSRIQRYEVEAQKQGLTLEAYVTTKVLSPAFEQDYRMPLVDVDAPKWGQLYNWLKVTHFTNAVDVIE